MNKRNIGIILSYLNTGLSLVCGLILSSYLLRMLGSTEYGVYQMISSFANYLVLLEFGTGSVMTRNIVAVRVRNESNEEISKNYSTIIIISVVLSFIILIVSVVFYFMIGTIYSESLTTEQVSYGKQIFIFITVYLIVSFFSQTMNGLALAYEDYCVIPIVSIARIVIRTILLIVLILFARYSIIIAIVDAVLGFVIGVFMFAYCRIKFKIKFKIKYFDSKILKASFPLCFAIFLQTIVNQANNNVDKFVIGIKLNPESVSLYSVALYIYSVFSSLTTIPISMYAPQIIQIVNSGKKDNEMLDTLVAPSRMIVIVGGVCLFGFIACGKSFISIVYGNEYLDAWLIAIIIMAPMFINMSNGVLINVLDAMDKRMFRSLTLTLTTIGNIILTVFWIDWMGMVGAAFATAISVCLGQITLMNIYYSKKIGINVLKMYRLTFKGILIYHMMGAALGFVSTYFIDNAYITLFVSGGTYMVIFFLGYLLFGMTDQERKRFKKIFKRV